MHPAFADFVRDAEAAIEDPHAIATRLEGLLARRAARWRRTVPEA